jgi:hypothetical protein
MRVTTSEASSFVYDYRYTIHLIARYDQGAHAALRQNSASRPRGDAKFVIWIQATRFILRASIFEKQANLPSVAVLAAIPDRGRYAFVVGVADLRIRAPPRFEPPFRIASVTKTFSLCPPPPCGSRGNRSRGWKLMAGGS